MVGVACSALPKDIRVCADGHCGGLRQRKGCRDYPHPREYLSTAAGIDVRPAAGGRISGLRERTARDGPFALRSDTDTCAGRSMQRIFTFGPDGLPTWDAIVSSFEQIWELSHPWRWENVGEGVFGAWVLEQRRQLLAGASIDFSAAPSNVRWIARPSTDDRYFALQRQAVPREPNETVIVINSSRDRDGRHRIARGGYGLSVVERADLPDLLSWAARLDNAISTTRSWQVIQFAQDVMTGIDSPAILRRLSDIRHGVATRSASDEERALLSVDTSSGGAGIASTLQQIARPRERVLFRHELFEAMCQTANMATDSRSLMSAAMKVVEQRAMGGRILPRRAVGSTLLLKGLEADHAVVFDADTMSHADLYVAISRASRTLTVISNSWVLPGP
jgi:hypothetical protein